MAHLEASHGTGWETLLCSIQHNEVFFFLEGYVDLDSILRHQRFRGATRETIRRIVESNDKKRFTIVTENGVEKIKANQGHSVEVGFKLPVIRFTLNITKLQLY